MGSANPALIPRVAFTQPPRLLFVWLFNRGEVKCKLSQGSVARLWALLWIIMRTQQISSRFDIKARDSLSCTNSPRIPQLCHLQPRKELIDSSNFTVSSSFLSFFLFFHFPTIFYFASITALYSWLTFIYTAEH